MPAARPLAAALLAAMLAACGSAGTAGPTTSSSTVATPSTTTAAPDPARAGRLVASIALTDRDLLKGYRVRPIEHGDEVQGQVTFDVCGHRFASETHRIARYQTDIVSGTGEAVGGSNEVVAYDSEAAAAAAVEEFRAAVRNCPKNTELPAGAGGSRPLRYLATSVRSEPGLPAKDNVVAVLTVQRTGSSAKIFTLVLLQRHGAVLDNLYINQPEPVTDADERTAVGVATPTGKRLVQLAGGGTA